jgi:hypothetical protein
MADQLRCSLDRLWFLLVGCLFGWIRCQSNHSGEFAQWAYEVDDEVTYAFLKVQMIY